MAQIKLSSLYPLLRRWWQEEQAPELPPPAAKFITGIPTADSQFHLLETKYGIRVVFSNEIGKVTDYDIVDEKKFTLFLLKWN